jgi:hypothetical protein
VEAASLLTEALLAREEGRWADAAEGAAGANRAYAAAGGEGGAAFAGAVAFVAGAHLEELNGEAVRAAHERLSALADGRAARRDPALRVVLLEEQIGLFAAAARAGLQTAPGSLETLLARYESARYRCRIDTADLRAYTAAAAARRHAEDADGAWPLYERALGAARDVYDALAPDPEAQDTFLARIHRTLLPEAATCARLVGREGDAALASVSLPDPAENLRRRAEAAQAAQDTALRRHASEGRRLRLAWIIAAADAVAGASLVLLGAPKPFDVLGWTLLCYLPITLFFFVFLRVGRVISSPDRTTSRNEGSILLALTLSAWATGAAALLASAG